MAVHSSASATNMTMDDATEANPSLMSQNRVNQYAPTLSQVCSIELDRTNYLMWSSLVLPMICGYKLDSFILGTNPCPELFLFEGNERKVNPKFEDMSPDVISQVLGCKSAQELWNAVKEFSRAQTRSRITLYKSELQRLRKGGLKMDGYLRKTKEIANNLQMAGCPLSNDDLVTQTLLG